jgi:hypothetical protein
MQLIKAKARGFRHFTDYRTMILFHCGKLVLGWECGKIHSGNSEVPNFLHTQSFHLRNAQHQHQRQNKTLQHPALAQGHHVALLYPHHP